MKKKAGRPKEAERMVGVRVLLKPSTLYRLREFARNQDRSLSHTLRLGLESFVNDYEGGAIERMFLEGALLGVLPPESYETMIRALEASRPETALRIRDALEKAKRKS